MENLRTMKRLLTITLAILVLATASFAATTATGTNTVSPTLQINAQVQSVISLTLSQGATAGISHCAVTAGSGSPDFTMDFGTVDALGLTTTGCGKSFGLNGTATAGVSDAIYGTDYVLTPAFAGQIGGTTGTIKAYVSTNFTPTNLYVVYDTANSSSLPATASSFSPMPTTSGTAVTVAPAVASGTGITRFVGVGVKPTNGAGSSGAAGSATVTYTLTIP
jgi:hypothetical protein